MKAKQIEADEIAPTRERIGHGDIERYDHAIADDAGRPVQPFRSVDTLMMMERRRTITPVMRQAGEKFRELFHRASLDALRAADVGRVPSGRYLADAMSVSQEQARRKVWAALQPLGGIASPAGSCVWFVVGCEQTVREWAIREGWGGRTVSQKTAAGILIGALGSLVGHFGLENRA